MNTTLTRAAATAGGLAIAAAFAVSCSQAAETTKDIASSASVMGSSAASAASSAVSSGASAASSAATSAASAAESAASSGASAASSAVSSVISGAPTTMSAPGVGEVTLDGPTAAAYQKFGGESALGMPTAKPEKVGEGTVATFANGTIFSGPATGAHVVQGEILRVYNEQDGPTGLLGWPAADETETGGGPSVVEGGWIAEFENGMITWTNQGSGSFIETITKN